MTPRLQPTKRSCDKLPRHWHCIAVAVHPALSAMKTLTPASKALLSYFHESGWNILFSFLFRGQKLVLWRCASLRHREHSKLRVHCGGRNMCLTCTRELEKKKSVANMLMLPQRSLECEHSESWGTSSQVWRWIVVFKEPICIWGCVIAVSPTMRWVCFFVPVAQIFRLIISFMVKLKKKCIASRGGRTILKRETKMRFHPSTFRLRKVLIKAS